MWRVGLFLALWLGACGPLLAADIYKWVDANGVTQYGSTPPPGVKATRLGAPPAVDPAAASQAAAQARQSIAEAERRASEAAGEAARRQAEREAQRQGFAERLRGCAAARQQLDVVTQGGPVFRFDPQGGRAYLADDARDAEIARLRGEVAALCTGLDSDAATRERWKAMNLFVACTQARHRLQTMEQQLAQTPRQDLERARRAVALACAPSNFPPDTGTQGEWFRQFP
jgi:hypothetical protein